MNIDGVNTGIVLDHIKAGTAINVYNVLKLNELDACVAIIQNASSHKYGKKDIIKIDAPIQINLDILGYLDSNITVNYIEDNKAVKKVHLSLPETIKDVIKCNNPRCITSTEQEIVHEFRLVDPEKKSYRCIYCDALHTAP